MNKKTFLSVGILLVLIALGIFFKGSEDAWICKDGEWIRKGSPKVSQPQTPCKGQSKVSELPMIPPDSTVVSFYSWLAKNEDALKNEAYSQSPYLTDNYKQKIQQSLAKDPTYNPSTCSQEVPTSYKIMKSSTNKTTAVVQIEQTFGKEKIMLPIDLQAVDKQWKIANISCP